EPAFRLAHGEHPRGHAIKIRSEKPIMSKSPRFAKILARGLLILIGTSVLAGCFFAPPGQYERRGCYWCGGYYHHDDRGDRGDDRGDH
ncbi:MAG: hypothetical protein M0Z85_07270, partial [Gammaproteobacteria bacterium]|nr:hypothetical protein [Gammaproteobacteria bacterium]